MKILLAGPRGFWAGVERAIECVERALDKYGPPVYVLNDIVHNATVVRQLAEKGAVFVKDLADVPTGSNLLFSAHGVPPTAWEQARQRDLNILDATCPLVEKVHVEARRFAAADCHIILIGERGHDEVTGTVGQAPDRFSVVFDEADVDALDLADESKVAYLTQTTLSVDDSNRVIEALRRRFPHIQAPPSDDICYATQNRQVAVRELAPKADLVLAVGDHNSANSNRLASIAGEMGVSSHLIESAEDIRREWFEGVETVLITSGASAPESLVREVIEFLRAIEPCDVEEFEIVTEDVRFSLPVLLRR
ncbi:MAG: 4-hydroxy-3-methylbut-2-enyl diphosphate reductase [Acidobacteria bacterium]|nr:4-hydroxy-3-methylbut-2-enyl diphosphate reductase [Acidobacteriota bacterium]